MRAIALSLAVLLASAELAAAGGNPEKGKQAFRVCGACHAVGPSAKNKIGPELNGVVGRKWASVSGFNYSQNLRDGGKKGRVWDEATLDKYIENPKSVAPHGRMPYAGLKNEAQRENIIAYLAQFDAEGQKK